jgi:DNA-binding transcriptional LysR family regulator
MYSFTFRQVEVFLEICHSGNFSSAAERLQISQPAISNVIRTLESQLGVELFVRRRGASCVLTRDGQRFRDCARLFATECEAIARGGRGRRSRPRPLRLFVGGHLLEDFVRPLLPDFLAKYPQLSLHFLPERSRDQLLAEIEAGKVDVAVLTLPRGEPTPASLRLCEVPAGIYCARLLRGPYTPARLAALPFILPPAGTALAVSMLREMESHGVVPSNVVSHCQYHDVRIRMAAQGKGAVFSVQSVVDQHDRERALRCVLQTEPWERRAYIDARLEPTVATAMASFITRTLGAIGGPAAG